jgi:ATP-dependent DNA helicase RecG
VRFEKIALERIDKPDYAERAVFESLVNALIHRDYIIIGSEIHIDMFDDRLVITSPGGMYKGKAIQEQDIDYIASERRNPVLADLFHRMKYMERRGSGLRKIINETEKLPGYSNEYRPGFFSDTSFQVTLKNINYKNGIDNGIDIGIEKSAEKLLETIRKNPQATQKELAELTGLSVRTVARGMKALRDTGVINRIGSDRSGFPQMCDDHVNGFKQILLKMLKNREE